MKNLITCLVVSVLSGVAFAGTPVVNEDFKFLASDGAIGDEFGYSVATSGDTVVVGARGDDDNGSYSGSAYVYRFDGSSWIETKLLASDGASDDYFGYSVAISGDTVVVGSYRDNDNGSDSGSAYVYRFDGKNWIETKLIASDGASSDYFGYSVAISGDTVVVGAHYDDDNGSSSGSAYVYRFDGKNWIETKLLASDGASSDYFGESVAISGDTIVVGAYADDDNGSDSGSAYVYRFDGKNWIETKLLASDGASDDRFGYSVAISEGTVVVGAYADDDNGSSSGSAYVYRFDGNNWIETKLLASDGASYDYFGDSVAISGDTVVVGAVGDDDNGSYSGSAYVYRFDGKNWIETKLLASDDASSDYFGGSVAISGDTVVVGAVGDDDNGSDSGSAYIFYYVDTDGDGVHDDVDNCYLYNPDQADCNDNGIGDVCDVADNTSPDCDQNGVPDECQPDCDGDGWIDPCDNEGDCDDDGIPDNCELDCNENNIPDDCDIIYGISQDCNENGVPDECDIADGTVEDCNLNGVPDSCEIADGTEEDCDANGVPDSCELAVPTQTKLLASDGASYDYFGDSVAISGDTVVVGAYADDDNGSDSGSAYVYRFDGNNWIETKLLASDGASDDRFGESVAISGDTIVVGSYRDDDNGSDSGSAYVYRFDGNNWIETKLLASDGASSDYFGYSVAISGDTVVVGARYDDDNGSSSGSAYVYRFDGKNWIETKLLASDGASSDYFGGSVAISGDTVVVGAVGDDDNGSYSGSAYVYRFDGKNWIETKLLASDGASDDRFGYSVAISEGTVVVGAYADDDNGSDSGSAYVYRFDGNNWIETKLLASDGASSDYFGESVAISGDTIVVGSYRDDDNGSDSGSAYVYRFDGNNWIETKLLASDGASSDYFGYSVAISGDTVVVGASSDDDNGASSGSAYVYSLDEAEFDCNSNGILDICDIEEDPSLDCDLDGLIDACSTADGTVEDCNENGIPDTCELEDPANDENNNGELDDCECVGDADGDEFVNVNDLLEVVGYWNTNAPQADLNNDGIVDVTDLLIVVGNWGPCE